jgi:hypothetical protein
LQACTLLGQRSVQQFSANFFETGISFNEALPVNLRIRPELPDDGLDVQFKRHSAPNKDVFMLVSSWLNRLIRFVSTPATLRTRRQPSRPRAPAVAAPRASRRGPARQWSVTCSD